MYVFKKKYGRMTVGAWLRCEMEQSGAAWMIAVGTVVTVLGIVVRAVSGSPYRVLMELGVGDLVPPVWLMTLFWTVSFFTVGCAAGYVLGFRVSGCDGDKYKGLLLFALMIAAEYCWYPTFFSASLVFLSLLETVLILCLSVGVTVNFCRLSKFAGGIVLLHTVWLVWMLFLNFAVFFKN